MTSTEFRSWLATRTGGAGVVGAFAERVCQGEAWLLNRDSSFHDEVSRAALDAALAEWSRSRRGPKTKENMSTMPLAAGAVTDATSRKRTTKASSACPGCNSQVTRGVQVRDERTGKYVSWHAECRDRKRFPDDARVPAGPGVQRRTPSGGAGAGGPVSIDRSYRKKATWRTGGRVREAVLNASGRRCVLCGHPGTDGNGRGLNLAHLVPAPLGSDDEGNLVAMCAVCHGKYDRSRRAATAELECRADTTPTRAKGSGRASGPPVGSTRAGGEFGSFAGGRGGIIRTSTRVRRHCRRLRPYSGRISRGRRGTNTPRNGRFRVTSDVSYSPRNRALGRSCKFRSRGVLGLVGMDGMAAGVEPSSAEPAAVHGPRSSADGAWLTAAEIAETFRVDRSTVYRWARAHAISSVKICGTRRFDAAAVAALTRGTV